MLATAVSPRFGKVQRVAGFASSPARRRPRLSRRLRHWLAIWKRVLIGELISFTTHKEEGL